MAVLYAGLFAIVLTAILLIAGGGLTRFAEKSASRDLAANARVFDELIDLRARQLRGAADVLSRDFGFREAVATSDAETIESSLESLRDRSRATAAFVIGMDGNLIGNGNAAVAAPRSLWGPLDAGQQKGMIRLGDQLALAAASPIETPDLIGWLVLAQRLDAREMDRLTQLAAVELEARVETSATIEPWMKQVKEGEVVSRHEGEHRLYHLSQIAALEQGLEPRLVLHHSLTKSMVQYQSLRWLLIVLALGAIALVVALSWHVARTISAPLGRLDEAARLIGEGRDVELKAETDDEIGRLAESFNQMVGAIEERERRIIHVGLHDGLTGLPNRKLFVEQLDQAISRLRGARQLMVIYADLDDFKIVNDTLGHPAGDALLRQVARHLCEQLPNAVVARLGGDEFAILIEEVEASQGLAALAEKVHACFQRTIMIDGQQASSAASLGVAIGPNDGNDGIALMKHADLALYRAKKDGKSTYHFFEPGMDEEARLRRQMELDLRTALREGGFELYFQPLYNFAEDRFKGFESLIRWPHPTRGMISPAEFIPLAEETGLILPIGEWVIREACRQAAAWPDNMSVAVNVSPRQFSAPGLSKCIMQALLTSGLAPERLELEITESIFIANVEKTLAALHDLRALGVRIALDDFGTGFSSLSYLRSFPFDKVKIDRSFVQDLCKGSNAHAVIRAITTLADALGMETLAEGVEELDQLEVLRREGCGNIQGFLFSKPLTVAEVHRLLSAGQIRNFAQVA